MHARGGDQANPFLSNRFAGAAGVGAETSVIKPMSGIAEVVVFSRDFAQGYWE
jgi:hypothetical protein